MRTRPRAWAVPRAEHAELLIRRCFECGTALVAVGEEGKEH